MLFVVKILLRSSVSKFPERGDDGLPWVIWGQLWVQVTFEEIHLPIYLIFFSLLKLLLFVQFLTHQLWFFTSNSSALIFSVLNVMLHFKIYLKAFSNKKHLKTTDQKYVPMIYMYRYENIILCAALPGEELVECFLFPRFVLYFSG